MLENFLLADWNVEISTKKMQYNIYFAIAGRRFEFDQYTGNG